MRLDAIGLNLFRVALRFSLLEGCDNTGIFLAGACASGPTGAKSRKSGVGDAAFKPRAMLASGHN